MVKIYHPLTFPSFKNSNSKLLDIKIATLCAFDVNEFRRQPYPHCEDIDFSSSSVK